LFYQDKKKKKKKMGDKKCGTKSTHRYRDTIKKVDDRRVRERERERKRKREGATRQCVHETEGKLETKTEHVLLFIFSLVNEMFIECWS
jgi:hypothetical protein